MRRGNLLHDETLIVTHQRWTIGTTVSTSGGVEGHAEGTRLAGGQPPGPRVDMKHGADTRPKRSASDRGAREIPDKSSKCGPDSVAATAGIKPGPLTSTPTTPALPPDASSPGAVVGTYK